MDKKLRRHLKDKVKEFELPPFFEHEHEFIAYRDSLLNGNSSFFKKYSGELLYLVHLAVFIGVIFAAAIEIPGFSTF